jgi:hypothetical protein
VLATLLVTERFTELARSTYESRGVSGGPMVIMARTEETEYSDRTTMERICDAAYRDFVRTTVGEAGVGDAVG